MPQNIDALAPYIEEVIFSFEVSPEWRENHFCFHLDYEANVYRQDALVRLIRDSVEYFALTHEEFENFRARGDVATARRLAWSRISKARKEKKGDYGELLLFLLLYFKMPQRIPRFVTKVRLRSSRGDQIKGFDCAHCTFVDNELCLWLGEAKFHESISTAIASAMKSLEDHSARDYLKDELRILGANIEANHGLDETVLRELDTALNKDRSIDRLKFNVPILLTYDSGCVQGNTSLCDKFRMDLTAELNLHFGSIKGKLPKIPQNFSLLLMFIPFRAVADIKAALEKIEEALK
jgi:hypothetical protein